MTISIQHKMCVYSIKSLVLFILVLLSTFQVSFSHGTVTTPPSRVWTCFQEGPENPNSPACIDAVTSHGTQPLYDWAGINQGFANGNHEDVVPNGTLASGGNPDKYGGMDQVRSDWITTDVTPGPYKVTWTNSAPHATEYFRVYITIDGWTPSQPLSWDKLILLEETPPSPAEAIVDIDITLPSKTGHHVLFSVWQRSDSQEAFYSASDVNFGGTTLPPDEDIALANIEGNLQVDHNIHVDSNLTVGEKMILQMDSDDKFSIAFEETENKLSIEEIGIGRTFEIKDGEIYLPQYTGANDRVLGLDANGKLIEVNGTTGSAEINTYNKFDFPNADAQTGYHTNRKGTNFLNDAVLQGLSGYFLDNDLSTGADDNSATVQLLRRNKFNNTLPDEVIYEVVSTTTASEVFTEFSTTTVVTAESNIIDNNSYIYFIEIRFCDDCDFRQVSILK